MTEVRSRSGSSPSNRARDLRRDSTIPERLLWGRLRGRGLAGLKFRRQHAFGPYVLDFYCHEAKLAVEVDGDSHDGRFQYDMDRQAWIQSHGVRVLRVGNDDVLHEIDSVLESILNACGIAADRGHPHPGPLPEGEGEESRP